MDGFAQGSVNSLELFAKWGLDIYSEEGVQFSSRPPRASRFPSHRVTGVRTCKHRTPSYIRISDKQEKTLLYEDVPDISWDRHVLKLIHCSSEIPALFGGTCGSPPGMGKRQGTGPLSIWFPQPFTTKLVPPSLLFPPTHPPTHPQCFLSHVVV